MYKEVNNKWKLINKSKNVVYDESTNIEINDERNLLIDVTLIHLGEIKEENPFQCK